MKGKIFNAQEVQAIIAGNKTQFREVIKVQPTDPFQYFATIVCSTDKKNIGKHHYINDGFPHIQSEKFSCLYQVGQKIFCKEDFCEKVDQDTFESLGSYHYRASCDFDVYMMDGDGWAIINKDGSERLAWKPAQHMKQEHSRLTLLIKEIRVERLQDISEEDAIAEGFKNTFVGFQHPVYNPGRTANQDFEIFWNATHKKPEEKFEANPLVWVISFGVLHASEMFNVSISTKF